MNRLISNTLLIFFTLLSLSIKAQLSDKEKFIESFYLIEEKRYLEAQSYLEELYEKDKENANLNYHLGLVYLKSFHEKEKERALPLLELASKNASPNFTPFNTREKKAPVDAWYYYGLAQHNDYQFLEAIESFNKFRTYINEKHYLWNEIDKQILMANYAMIAVQNPVKIKTTNLGDALNGFYPDFSPVVRIDESAMYFTSRRMREDSSNADIYDPVDGMLYEDIYVSFNEDGKWSEAYPLNINSEGHEATVNLSVDGRTLYIYKDINGNGELYKSVLEDDSAGFETWSQPEKLGSNINSKAYETHVAVTPDEKTLYFVSDREGGFGGKDIYFCRRLPTGQWALAQNAGPILNSEYDEDGVFIHPDGKTMYFSSNGHESMGGYDINYSTLTDSGWTNPENIGYPINSVDDDVFFVTTPDGKRAYFSSFKEEGYGEKDVYMLELVDAEEIALTLYRGEFTFVDRRTPPSGAEVAITDNETGELVGFYTPRERDGQFSAILQPNKSYHFVYSADAYESYEEDIYVSANNSYSEIYKDIKLKPVRVGNGLDKITPAPIAYANVKGGLTKIGNAVVGMGVQLLDEEGNILSQTTTDELGNFEFEELDPYKTYLVKVLSDEGDPLQNYKLTLENDQNEELVFNETDEDLTYIFVPSTSPYEFYGISAKEIYGVVKKDGVPVEGLKVRLEDSNNEVLQQNQTDEFGKFDFRKLSLDEKYRLVFDNDIDDPEILITNELGEILVFKKVGDGIYEYVPITSEGGNQQIVGVASNNGTPLNGLKVRLEDQNQVTLQSTQTDQVGEFNFTKLDLNNTFRIVFEGDFPDDTEIILLNEFGEELTFVKVADGVYEYTPATAEPKAKYTNIEGTVTSKGDAVADLKVMLFDMNMQLLNFANTDDVGKFHFMKLNLARSYTIKFEGDYPEDVKLIVANDDYELLPFRKIEDGIYRYDPVYVRLITEDENIIKKEITDNVNEFNYAKLKIDEYYKIVFDGNFPLDDELVVYNENGDKLVFKKTAEGVYEYTPRPKPSQIAGVVKKGDSPLTGLNVRLEDASQNMLQQETTDHVGEFNFQKLDLDQTYRIVFEGDFPDDAVIVLRNEYGQELNFIKVSDGVYEYVPKKGALPKAKYANIAGTVSSEGVPVKDLKVLLLDANENLLNFANTDDLGKFDFMKLNLAQSYIIRFEGDFPPDVKLIVANDDYDLLLFRKLEEGLYRYDPVFVKLVSEDESVIKKEITDNVEEFNYEKLKLDKYYKIVFDGNFPDDDEIIITNKKGEEFVFKKTAEGVYEYTPVKTKRFYTIFDKNKKPLANANIRIVDKNRNLIERIKANELGGFAFEKLPMDTEFWFILEDTIFDTEKIIITSDMNEEIVLLETRKKGEYLFTPMNRYGFKSFTIGVQGSPDYKETYPRPEDLVSVIAYYQKYFPYNAKDIDESNTEFKTFISNIAELVKQRGHADIIITSSASKVPTKTWKTNSILTKKRAYDTKALLERIFKSKGISSDKYNFVDINTLITGPEYKGDYKSNRSTYEKHQYVRIFIK